MKEEFLYFIWTHQIFEINNLRTNCKQKVTILEKGSQNYNQGPDFKFAKIRIGDEILFGHIEFHISNQEWYTHKHHTDRNYNNVILHITYNNCDELSVKNQESNPIPILNIENYVNPKTIENYEFLKSQKKDIPCSEIFKKPNSIYINKFKEKLLIERLIDKSQWIKKVLENNNNHIEASFYQVMMYSFGLKVNSEAFLEVAQSIPLTILSKVNDNLIALEAILLGQANLLDYEDKYSQKLKNEYKYYQKLYSLKPIQSKVLFSKILPSSFPTLRLVQFAAFIHKQQRLYPKLSSFSYIEELYQYFNVKVSEYWLTHYNFTSSHSERKKKLSKEFIHKMMINSILPFIFLTRSENEKSIEPIIERYLDIPPENNSIIKLFTEILDISNKNAFESQAILQWKNNYCDKKRCLECPVGLKTIR